MQVRAGKGGEATLNVQCDVDDRIFYTVQVDVEDDR